MPKTTCLRFFVLKADMKTLLNETKIGEEHPEAQDGSVPASHTGRCDGQSP